MSALHVACSKVDCFIRQATTRPALDGAGNKLDFGSGDRQRACLCSMGQAISASVIHGTGNDQACASWGKP